MALSDTALVTVVQAKNYLRVDAAASLKVDAEYIGVGDGEVVAFDLDNTPVEGSLQLYIDGTLQVEVTDYTISTAAITFVTAPGVGEKITASYDTAAGDNTFESYDDDLIERLIATATKKAEDYTEKAFIQRTITEKYSGDATTILNLYRQPVVTITSVKRYHSSRVGTGDGTTVAFTLSDTPYGSIVLYIDGVLQVLTTDYTISGAVITFDTAPADEARISANYYTRVSDYTERIHIGRLYRELLWTQSYIYEVVYVAGYAATRAATQALIPEAVTAVLIILAFLFENRPDKVNKINISGVGSTSYELPSQAEELLEPLRTSIL